jgi:DNA-binding beta-propeller fold protein YncE
LSATSPPTTTLAKPVALLVDPSGRFLFVAANGAARVQAFLINQTTGALSPSMPNLSTAPQPTALAVDPTGSTLYVATIGGVPRFTGFTINQTGGAPLGASSPSPTSAVGGPTGLAVDPAASWSRGDMQLNALHTFPVATSVATVATTTPNSSAVGRQPVSLALDPLGRFVYVSSNIDATLSAFTPNRTFSNVAAGAVVSLGISPPRMPRTVLVDPSGQFVYVADEMGKVMAFRVNQTTGALTFIADFAVTAGGHPFALAIVRQPL